MAKLKFKTPNELLDEWRKKTGRSDESLARSFGVKEGTFKGWCKYKTPNDENKRCIFLVTGIAWNIALYEHQTQKPYK